MARRVLRDRAEAEDTVQQIFLDFYRSAEKFDPEKGTFKSWLLMFSYCRVLNRKRQLQSRAFYASDSLEEFSPEIAHARERTFPFNTAEATCLVEEALNLIKPRQRRVIELVYYEGLTSDEVAKRTGESVRVVRHHLYRGLDKIRSVLRSAESQEGSANSKGARREPSR
jgi:RNA polymerase sigma-70 factor (ECF subfamily)